MLMDTNKKKYYDTYKEYVPELLKNMFFEQLANNQVMKMFYKCVSI